MLFLMTYTMWCSSCETSSHTDQRQAHNTPAPKGGRSIAPKGGIAQGPTTEPASNYSLRVRLATRTGFDRSTGDEVNIRVKAKVLANS